MKANNAIKLLNDTFQNKFDLNQYQRFLRDLFNTSNIGEPDEPLYVEQ